MKLFYLTILFVFLGCDSEPVVKINMSDNGDSSKLKEKQTTLRCAGCKTEYYLIKELAEGFGKKIKINPTGNQIAVKQLLNNELDFAETCKSLKTLSRKIPALDKRKSEFECISIAKDAIVVIVNKANPVTNLSLQAISDIYSGKTTNWRDIGWAEGGEISPIVINQKNASGTATVFKEMTIGKSGKYSSNIILSPSDSEMPELIKKFPEMIGYCVLGKTPDYVKKIYVSGIAPEIKNITDNSYPIVGTYHLIYPKKHNKQLGEFLEFVKSKKGKEIINNNFISIK